MNMPQNKAAGVSTSGFGDVDQPDVIDLNKTIASELATVSVAGYLPLGHVPIDMRWGVLLREFLVTIDSINASYGSALAVLEKSTLGEKRARDIGDDHARIAHICEKVGGMSVIIKNLLLEKDLLLGGLKLLFNEMKALDLLQREHPELVQQYHEKINRAEVESKKVLSSIDKISRLVDGLDAFGADVEPKQRDILIAHASALDQLTAENITEQALRAQQGAKIREMVGFEQQQQQAPEEVGSDIQTADSIAGQKALAENIVNVGPEQEETEEEGDGDEPDTQTGDEDEKPEEDEEAGPSAIDDMIEKVLAPKKKDNKGGD